VTNDITAIGRNGFGQMTVSNASVQLTNSSVGRHDGAIGRLLVQRNGMVKQIDDLSIGRFANSSGYVEVDGGFLSLTNDNVWVGREGAGNINVLEGLMSAQSIL
jgi:T5SS/PEP-CTERM-associated repeat protein